MKKFLIIDDHSIVRAGIKLILKKMFPGAEIKEAYNEKSSLAFLKDEKFTLIFMDLNMPDSDPAALIHYILNKNSEANIIILTMNDENVYAKRFFKLGIKGFLNKSIEDTHIEAAITAVLSGQLYISDNLKRSLAESLLKGKTDNPFESLSDRELQVAQELIKGKSISEISGSLNIHASTVSTYKAKVFEKLNIPNNNLVELLSIAQSYNVI